MNRFGRTTTKDVAPAAPAKRPPAATSAGLLAKRPASSARRFQQSGRAEADIRHNRGGQAARADWKPTGWAARKEPLRSKCVQRHYTLLMEAGGDWRNPLPQADGSSFVLRMRVVNECSAIPFSGQLVAWAAALGFNAVDNSRGGRQIGGRLVWHHRCLQLRGLGRSW